MKEQTTTQTAKNPAKNIIAAILILTAAWIVTTVDTIPVYAQEELQEVDSENFMKALQKIDVKAAPDNDAETIFSYDEGAYVYVTGETGDGWLIVYYQGKTGYIKNNILQGAVATQEGQGVTDGQVTLEVEEIDMDALDEEWAAQEVESMLLVEEVEMYRAERRRSMIWGAVIISLVIAIFVIGIVSAIGSKKKDEADPKEKRDETDNESKKSAEDSNGAEKDNLKIIDLDSE